MAILGKFVKQPQDVLDYDFDYRDWLLDRNDTITTATVVSDSPELIVQDSMHYLGVVKCFIEGGVNGGLYKLTCTIATTGGRIKQAEVSIAVKEF